MFIRVLALPLFLAEFEHLLALKVNFLRREFHVVTTVEEMIASISLIFTSFGDIQKQPLADALQSRRS